jgi:hypothetical protein
VSSLPRTSAPRHGFGLVFVLVLASASFQVAAPDTDWARLVTIVLGAATLFVSARAARAHDTVVRGAVLVAIVLALLSLVVLVGSGDIPRAAAALVNGLLVAVAPTLIAVGVLREVRAEGEVSVRTLSGVLSIYLLLGMCFSFLDAAVAEIDDGRFFAGVSDPDRSDFLYFSYVTLATVGYGDLVAVSAVGRMLAATEGLLGQIYLVTVVALIVANLRPRAHRQPPPQGVTDRGAS